MKFNVLMDSIVAGSNHSCAFSTSSRLYTWGHNNANNRLGIKSLHDTAMARIEPLPVSAIEDTIDKI